MDMSCRGKRPLESPAAKFEMAGSEGGKNMKTD